ncbi:hypothetical protein FD754_024598 [Muntiacus muntjak]|uniref:Interleukin-32 n=1 Tax=Muntiacus muntjak TaxID=9888 RepID=A0A5N3UPC0_MUNMU|nr:hypothetical protein FD754_024599 [Muntiacus muntjak]KAB0338417.1 hypothetical protein FD754_024598 [Muntiacus muntjak]
MGSGALAPFRLTWVHGGRQWGPLTSAAGQECRPHTSSPQEALSKDIVEYLEDHIQENLPESQQESSPLLQETWQEVRHRIQRFSVSASVSASLEVQNPEESIWARTLRRFLGFLQSLLQQSWDVLTWLREMAAAILEPICCAVKAVWGVLTDFCSSVGQLLRSLIQV